MKIVVGRPPVYDEIVRVIGRPPPTAGFTWGDIFYVQHQPDGPLDPALLEHETTHSWQQQSVGGPERWWRQYLDSPAFRLREELVAYRAQYLFACRQGLRRPDRRQFGRDLAKALSSAMYGNVIRRAEALEAITA